MMGLPQGFSLDDLAVRESLDPVLDELTREWVKADRDLQAWEVGRCAEDYVRFARRWLTIRTPTGPQRLRFKPAQSRLHALVWEKYRAGKPVRVRVLKARQEGISTYVQGLQFWQCAVARTHVSGLTIAHEVEAVQVLLGMSRQFLRDLPDFLRPEVRYDARNHIEFRGRRTDMKLATARNAQAGRARTLIFLHCSEVGFWNRAEEVTTSLYQAVPLEPETFIFEESTANGVGNYFYQRWKETQERQDRGESTEWVNVFIPWTEEPRYRMELYADERKAMEDSMDAEEEQLHRQGVSMEQLKWRRYKIRGDLKGDVDRFHQEYPSHWEEAFISTGRPYFDRLVLVGWRTALDGGGAKALPVPLKTGTVRERGGREEVTPIEAEVLVWELPRPGVEYVIGADISEGVSPNPNNNDPDYSVADVGRLDTWDQVAELRGRFDADVFGALLVELGRMYNDALLAPEAHGIGVAVINVITKLGYPNIYYRVGANGEPQPGWETNLATKGQMLSVSRGAVRDGVGMIRSSVSLAEHMAMEVAPNGKVQVSGGHDDCVMARAIRLKVTEERAPLLKVSARGQRGLDMTERLRRWRRHAEAEARQKALEEARGVYYDTVLGRVE